MLKHLIIYLLLALVQKLKIIPEHIDRTYKPHILKYDFIFIFQPWRFDWWEWFMARLKSSFYVSWSEIEIQTASISLCKTYINQWMHEMWFRILTANSFELLSLNVTKYYIKHRHHHHLRLLFFVHSRTSFITKP